MNVRSFDRNNAIIECDYDTVYVLLQCVADLEDRLSDDDINTIIGVDRTDLSKLSTKLNKLKWDMRPKDN